MIAGFFGFLIGKPTLRLSGIFLTLATLGFNIIYVLLMINLEGLTRGPLGIAGISTPKIFSYRFSSQIDYYYLIFFLVLFTLGSIYRIIHSRFGKALLAIREEETAAEAIGVNTVHYKIVIFTLSTFYAGIAGSFFAHLHSLYCAGQLHLLGIVHLACHAGHGGPGKPVGSHGWSIASDRHPGDVPFSYGLPDDLLWTDPDLHDALQTGRTLQKPDLSPKIDAAVGEKGIGSRVFDWRQISEGSFLERDKQWNC